VREKLVCRRRGRREGRGGGGDLKTCLIKFQSLFGGRGCDDMTLVPREREEGRLANCRRENFEWWLIESPADMETDDNHKVRLYKEYHSVCPLVRIGTLPTPLSPASVPLPPEPGLGGRHTRLWRLWVRGWRSPNSDDWRKNLELCLLCDDNRP
jgi:hypothetical protein